MGSDKLLSKAYYSTNGYWKGYSAIEKLANAAKVSESIAKKWLEKQALWQIYLQSPNYVPRPHWVVNKPNQIHQADLLFMPHDKVGRNTYIYALVVVDIASRYKDAEALTAKYSSGVAKGFEKIYSRKLKWPHTLIVDLGTEFMGDVTKIMKNHNVTIQISEAGNHRAQAFVEQANRTLAEKLFSYQYAQEMVSDDRSRVWVKGLPDVIKSLNGKTMRITGKEPVKAIRLKEVDIEPVKYKRPVGFDENRLPPGVRVRYLLAPGEDEGGERRRATDPIWSLEVFDMSRSVVTPRQPMLHYLLNGP